MQKYPTSLIIREMQTKTTVTYHPTAVKMSIIKNIRDNRCWWGWGEKGTLLYCWWECKLVQPLWKTVWRFLKKLEIEHLIQQSPSGHIFKGNEITMSKRYLHSYDHCRIIHKAKIWKQPKCLSTNEWIKKMWYIYTVALKKKEILPFATAWMKLEGIYAKRNNSDRERQISYGKTYRWNLKKKSQTHRNRVEW